MQQLKDLRLLCSTAPIILMETHEENRVMELFDHLFKGNLKSQPMYKWAVTLGLKRLDIDKPAQLHTRPDRFPGCRQVRSGGEGKGAEAQPLEVEIMARIGIRDLLEAGAHFGHQTQRWNPKMRKYIFDGPRRIKVLLRKFNSQRR